MDYNSKIKIMSVGKSDRKKYEMNFEKLYMTIVELKQEAQKTLSIFREFFKNYIDENQTCNPIEIMKFLSNMEDNKVKIASNKKVKNLSLREKNRLRHERILAQNCFAKTYFQISSALTKNKPKYTENVLMRNSEINSLAFYIYTKGVSNKNLQEEFISIDEKVSLTKAENKTLCAREYELMCKIIYLEKQLLEYADQRNKNCEILKRKESEYAGVIEKLKTITKIKENVLNSTKLRRTCLMRKAFKLKKFNGDFEINNKVKKMLSSPEIIDHVRSFTLEESLIYSEIFDKLKIFYNSQQERILNLEQQAQEKQKSYNCEKETLMLNFLQLKSRISRKYEDIHIENLVNSNDPNLSNQLYEMISGVNRQILYKTSAINSKSILLESEYEDEKRNLKIVNNKIIEKMKIRRDRKAMRKSLNVLRSLAIVRKERRERDRREKQADIEKKMENEKLENEIKEKERLEKLEKEIKEKEQLENERLEKRNYEMEKERLAKEKIERERVAKEKLERERVAKDKLEREGVAKDKLERDKQVKEHLERERLAKDKLEMDKQAKDKLERERLAKENENERQLREAELEELLNYDTGFNFSNVGTGNANITQNKKKRVNSREAKQKEPQPRKSKRNKNSSIHIIESNFSNNIANTNISQVNNNISQVNNNISQVNNNISNNLSSQQQGKFNFKVNLNSLEESFKNQNSNKLFDTNHPDLLDEISKNINEVSEFPANTSYGRDRKKRYLSSFNY